MSEYPPSTGSFRGTDVGVANKWAIWCILVFVIVVSHIDGLFVNNFDDLSVLRASAYVSRFLDDPLLSQLKGHLEDRKEELGSYRYQRYRLRLGSEKEYLAQNWLVGVLERLPLYSAYQSVFLANLALHLVAATLLFATFNSLFTEKAYVFQTSFLLSLSPSLFFYPVHLGHLFPFQDIFQNVLWSVSAPRGIALTFFFVSLVLWLGVGHSVVSTVWRLVLAGVSVAASILSHRSMGLLLIGSTFLVAILYRVVGVCPVELPSRVGFRNLLLLFNGAVILVAILKLVFLLGLGSPEVHVLAPGSTGTTLQLGKNVVKLLSWLFATNLLAYWWLRQRKDTGGAENNVLQAGDGFFGYLMPFSVMAIGLNAFHPGKDAWYFYLLAPTEGSLRITGMAHILWWMVFGIWLHAAVIVRHKRILYRSVMAVLYLSCIGAVSQVLLRERTQESVMELLSQEKLLTEANSLLLRSGIQAYADESLYFQSIANQLKRKSASKVMSDS